MCVCVCERERERERVRPSLHYMCLGIVNPVGADGRPPAHMRTERERERERERGGGGLM